MYRNERKNDTGISSLDGVDGVNMIINDGNMIVSRQCDHILFVNPEVDNPPVACDCIIFPSYLRQILVIAGLGSDGALISDRSIEQDPRAQPKLDLRRNPHLSTCWNGAAGPHDDSELGRSSRHWPDKAMHPHESETVGVLC